MPDEIPKFDDWVKSAPTPSRGDYDPLIIKHAQRTGLDPDLVRRLTNQESRFKRGAVSPKGASGLMQLMPATAKSLGVKNIFDPDENIRGGTDYLKQQLDEFGDVPKALAAYNAGPGAVRKYGGVPPYKETQNYVKTIGGGYQGTGYAQGAKPQTAIPKFDDWAKSQDEKVVAPGRGKQGPMVVRRQAAEAANPQVSNFDPAQPSNAAIPSFDEFQKQSAPATGTWASNLYNQKPKQPRTRPKPAAPALTSPQISMGQGAVQGETNNADAIRQGVKYGAPPGFSLLPTSVQDAVAEQVAKGGKGLLRQGAGAIKAAGDVATMGTVGIPEIARAVTAPTRGSINTVANKMEQGSQVMQREANRNVVSQTAQDLVGGTIASAPALVLQRLGVPGPVAFGLQSYLESTGRDAELSDVLKETGLATATGGLYEIPLPRAAKATLLRQIGAKLGVGAIGGTALAKAFGLSNEEAIKQGILTGGMMTLGSKRGTPEPQIEYRESATPNFDERLAPKLKLNTNRDVAKVPDVTEAPAVTQERPNAPLIKPATAEPQIPPPEAASPAAIPPEVARLQDQYDRAQQRVKDARVAARNESGSVGPAHQELEMAGKVARGLGMRLSAAKKAAGITAIVPEPSTLSTVAPKAVTPDVAPKEAVSSTSKPSRLAQGVEAKAVAAKLTEGFADLPEYKTVKVADQAQKATELLNSDPELAKRIATGQEMPKGDLLPESVFTAVENRALANGDVQTIEDLARGSRSVEASGMGQRIRMLGERNPHSPVKAIADIEKARSAGVPKEKVAQVMNKIKTEVSVEMKKSYPKGKEWSTFLDSIMCR